MGYSSYFVKATGDCRIMLEKVRKYVKKKQSKDWMLEHITTITSQDDKEESITLEQFGKAVSGAKIHGYLNEYVIWDLYLIYQAMSLNGRQRYKSEIELEIPMEPKFCELPLEVYESIMSKKLERELKIKNMKDKVFIKGPITEEDSLFSSHDEMLTFLKPYRINPYHEVPIMKIVTKGFHDVKIVIYNSYNEDDDIGTEEETVTNSRTKKQKMSSNEEPCRLYFLVDYPQYIYFEFLPYGRGIKLAEAMELPRIGSDDDDDYEYLGQEEMLELLKQTRDDAFSWSVKTLLY